MTIYFETARIVVFAALVSPTGFIKRKIMVKTVKLPFSQVNRATAGPAAFLTVSTANISLALTWGAPPTWGRRGGEEGEPNFSNQCREGD